MTAQAVRNNNDAPVKLSARTLPQLAQNFEAPTYDRAALKPGILHMSVGGFHRSHQAVYIDNLLKQNPGDWMITGVGLLPNDAANIKALEDQDGLYAVLERAPESDHVRIVGSMKNVLHAPANPQAVLDLIASPETKIVSLTVTEKGYYYDDKRNLILDHPAVKADLDAGNAPVTALGYLARGIKARMQNNGGAFTIMCCDNLPGNGEVTKHILLQFVNAFDATLTPWIEENISFPNAMVDRITPVTTDAIKATLADEHGIDDAWPVVCEDYIQWVLEDNFKAGRPALEQVGVQVVADVEPYEKMKVRLLNGSHSALSYVSYLMGYRDVDAAMADPLIKQFVENYMEDVTPCVPDVPGIDLTQYKAKLVSRFANPAVRDQVLRLCEDGSAKIPNSIVPPIEYATENMGSIKWLALAMAAWLRFLNGVDEQNNAIPVKDPMKDTLTARAQNAPRDPLSLLGVEQIFGRKIIGDKRFVDTMAAFVNSIYTKGMKATLEDALKA